MRRKKVLLDCDGVLADFTGAVLPIVERVTGQTLYLSDWDQYEFEKAFDLTAAEKALVVKAIEAPGFCRNIRLFSDAADGVRMLRGAGHEVQIVTSPWDSKHWIPERTDWLLAHFGVPDVLFRRDKENVDGDMIVDDRFATIELWQAAHPGAKAVLWDLHHNRKTPWGLRTNHWPDVVRWLEASP